jgi:allantoinase
MKLAKELGLLVAVHAEIDHPELCQGTTVRDYLALRPIAIELEAIRIAVDLATETGCALHVVHVSSAAGVALITEARARGVDVTCETCPHYLVLGAEDMERLGAVAKCAPPLRGRAEQERLLRCVLEGDVQTIGSDHSPAPAEMKADANFFQIWGGISGCQHLLMLLLDLGLPHELIERVTRTKVAERFGLTPEKGALAIGAYADLVLVDPNEVTAVTPESLFYRHRQTPYMGRKLRGRVVRTFLRGETVFHDGAIVGAPCGRLLRRTL